MQEHENFRLKFLNFGQKCLAKLAKQHYVHFNTSIY